MCKRFGRRIGWNVCDEIDCILGNDLLVPSELFKADVTHSARFVLQFEFLLRTRGTNQLAAFSAVVLIVVIEKEKKFL